MIAYGIDIYIWPMNMDGSVRVDLSGINPEVVPCTVGQWTKVATATLWARIWRKTGDGQLRHTYRSNGAAPPTDLTDAEPFLGISVEYNHNWIS